MRRKRICLIPVLILALALSGCELPSRLKNWHWERPDWMKMEGTEDLQLPEVLQKMMFWRQEEPEPTPEPTPSPTPAPELAGVAAEAQTFLEAVRDGDGETVERYGGSVPGYIGEGEFSSAALRELYRAVYGGMSWRFGAVSESMVSGSVEVEITARDMRAVLSALSERLDALAAADGLSGLDDAALETLLDDQLADCLAEESGSVTRKTKLSLKLQGEAWRVSPSTDLSAALTGGLSLALPDFALPSGDGRDVVMDEQDRSVQMYLMGNSYGSVIVTGIRPNAEAGYTLEVTVANYLRREAVFSLRSAVVNGYVLSPDWSLSVPARGEAKSTIVWNRADMERCGISHVSSVNYTLDVFERPAWPVYPLHSHYGTLSLDRAREQVSPRVSMGERQVLLEDGAAVVSVLAERSLGSWGYELTVYLENNSGGELWYSLGDVYVNGQELDPLWSQTLPNGTRAVETITFTAGSLLLRGVSAVEKLDFRLYVSSLENLDDANVGYSGGGRFVLSAGGEGES